jgi:hypothetical protein
MKLCRAAKIAPCNLCEFNLIQALQPVLETPFEFASKSPVFPQPLVSKGL